MLYISKKRNAPLSTQESIHRYPTKNPNKHPKDRQKAPKLKPPRPNKPPKQPKSPTAPQGERRIPRRVVLPFIALSPSLNSGIPKG